MTPFVQVVRISSNRSRRQVVDGPKAMADARTRLKNISKKRA
jgi:hypothetical protein